MMQLAQFSARPRFDSLRLGRADIAGVLRVRGPGDCQPGVLGVVDGERTVRPRKFARAHAGALLGRKLCHRPSQSFPHPRGRPSTVSTGREFFDRPFISCRNRCKVRGRARFSPRTAHDSRAGLSQHSNLIGRELQHWHANDIVFAAARSRNAASPVCFGSQEIFFAPNRIAPPRPHQRGKESTCFRCPLRAPNTGDCPLAVYRVGGPLPAAQSRIMRSLVGGALRALNCLR